MSIVRIRGKKSKRLRDPAPYEAPFCPGCWANKYPGKVVYPAGDCPIHASDWPRCP